MMARRHCMTETGKLVALALGLAGLAAVSLRAEEATDATWKKVDTVLGASGKDLSGGVHRFGWPRRDLHVRIGEVPVQAALGLGSWGAFVKTGHGDEAMAMGDLGLLESGLAGVGGGA